MPPGNSELPDAGDSDRPTSAEAAEQAAAEAEARAQVARERATELRRKLESARGDVAANDEAADDEPASPEPAPAPTVPDVTPAPTRRRVRLPGLKVVAATVTALLIAGSLAGTGYMVWKHRKVVDEQHRAAEFAAAARQGVVNLMSMDPKTAKENVQRVIDNSTGKFQANVKDGADDLIKAMQDAKVVTTVTINDVAVERIGDSGDYADVLVAATSQRDDTKAPKADKQPRVWRVVITVVRDGGQIKVSDVEFA